MNQQLVRVRTVEPLDGYYVRVEFADGTRRDIDLEVYLHGPMFEPLRRNPALFRAVKVEARSGALVWPNGADIDPDVLYYGLRPAWMADEEHSPACSAEGMAV